MHVFNAFSEVQVCFLKPKKQNLFLLSKNFVILHPVKNEK